MPKITGWKKTKNESDYQVWLSRDSRVAGDNSANQQPTRVQVSPLNRNNRGTWAVRVDRPNKNPKAPGFQEPIKKKFSKKSKAEDWAIDWMRSNKY
jgi:hypothetical protein